MKHNKFHQTIKHTHKNNSDEIRSNNHYIDSSSEVIYVLSSIDSPLAYPKFLEANSSIPEGSDLIYGEQIELYLDNELKYSDSASNFIRRFAEKPLQIINVLSEVIKSLKKTQDYNSLYVSYLLDQLSEEEFMNEAESFSYEPALELDKNLIEKIEILYSFVKESFTTSDIANIFKVDIEVAEKALDEISKEIGIE